MTRLGWRLAVVLTVAVAATAVVVAHMKLERTVPAANSTIGAPPAEIQAWFTQKPDPKVSRLTLEGPAGPVTLGAVHVGDDKSLTAKVEGSLANGAYQVTWQAAGDDGHVQKGTFGFTLRQTR